MRIDKYLKLTRLIKRRTVAKVLIDEGNILINDKTAKPSSEIKVGDTIVLKLGSRVIKIEVLNIVENVKKEFSKSLFRIIDETLTTK